MTKAESPVVGGKTIDEWDRLWTPVPGGLGQYHPDLRSKVGLYRVCRDGKVMALGSGVKVVATMDGRDDRHACLEIENGHQVTRQRI